MRHLGPLAPSTLVLYIEAGGRGLAQHFWELVSYWAHGSPPSEGTFCTAGPSKELRAPVADVRRLIYFV